MICPFFAVHHTFMMDETSTALSLEEERLRESLARLDVQIHNMHLPASTWLSDENDESVPALPQPTLKRPAMAKRRRRRPVPRDPVLKVEIVAPEQAALAMALANGAR